ncbi:TPA: TIGR03752 family integrating conjugative element protein [Legionella pneumophila]|nr:TIGR03752 family integrating conjugative element protein [Legionella pneumophila]HCC3243952.1 TIGR03752 family integrating conjugative element protein [Legionella pneumophila subsp. pneumophila]HAT8576079.1 TIGR03752 family integrating conjugative element protein [Legionella pneumophila]HAU2216447.1 TIGR03752 family integrating conjugative element protein [Legionella pneumophila]HBD7081593.1 TIGR03752 family integrating conjugative element protein [Legionella pneumophila]
MKKNAGLKVLTGVVVGVAAIILMNSNHHSNEPTKQHNDPNNLNEAIASQFNDNIRDVAARLQETEKKLASLEAENNRLKLNGSEVTDSSNPELIKDLERLKEEIASLKTTNETPQENSAYPVNGEPTTVIEKENAIKDIDLLLMKNENNQTELAYWERLKEKGNALTQQTKLDTAKSESKKFIPYYTIPAGSDLGRTTLLSALIGEVPVEGKLMQPLFPFSAIINRGDLMAANGISLPPDISGMKVNGYAIGVGSFLDNISCVRAYVTSALFVFDDGHFVTVGKEQITGTAEMVNNESLGYLTTAFGNPCIKGQYFTNAPRVLTALMASDGIKGFGNALSQWQMTYSANANGTTGTPTGSMGNYALGGALSQGTVKAADWLEKRIQGSFDMVFVPASVGYRPTRLSLHITQTINLDKETNGRVLDYGHLQQTTHDFSLR